MYVEAPETNQFEYKEYSIRYKDSGGEGPVLFCCTGVGGSLELWTYQFLLANKGVRVIAWDYPAHGLSSEGTPIKSLDEFADLALALLNHLHVKAFSVIGNSMGGAVALRIANKAGRRVRRLFLLNAASLSKATPLPFRLMCLPLLGGIMTAPGDMAYANQINAIFDNTIDINPDVLAAIKRNTSNKHKQRGFLQGVRVMNTIMGQRPKLINESLFILEQLYCPVTFIHGRNDKVIPFRASVDANQICVNSTLIIIDSCGHTPQVEYPNVVNDNILQCLIGGQCAREEANKSPM